MSFCIFTLFHLSEGKNFVPNDTDRNATEWNDFFLVNNYLRRKKKRIRNVVEKFLYHKMAHITHNYCLNFDLKKALN